MSSIWDRTIWCLVSMICVAVNGAAQNREPAANRPELIVQTGHYGEIQALVFSPDGRTWATGSADGTVKIWDLVTGAELRTIIAESKTIYSIAFSPDGKLIATGGFDQRINLWDVASGAIVRTIPVGQPVQTIAFNPNGKTIASGHWDDLVKLWDVASGALLRSIKAPTWNLWATSVTFSRDGNILAAVRRKTVTLWDMSTGLEMHTLNHDTEVSSIAFNPDGKTIASSTKFGIRIWDTSTGKELRTINAASFKISFSPDGKKLAGAGWNYTINLWDVATGELLRTAKGASSGQPLSGVESANVNKPDGKVMSNASLSMAVAFAADGKTLASGHYDNTVLFWDVATGAQLAAYKQHTDSVYEVAISPDGKTLASGDYDNTVRLWDLATGAEVRALTGHGNTISALTFSPDGKILASGSYDGTIKLWDVSCGLNFRTLKGNATTISAIAFSPDGSTLASVNHGKFWDIDATISLWNISTGAELRTFNRGFATSVAFSIDGKTLATGGKDMLIKLWDLESGAELPDLKGHKTEVYQLAFNPDGKTLTTSGSDHTVRVWDYRTGAMVRTVEGPFVEQGAFNRDCTMLAVGDWYGRVQVWDFAKGSSRRLAGSHAAKVTSVAITPNDKYVISGSQDGTIKVWDIASATELATLIALDRDDWLTVTPDGLFDGSPPGWKQILWRFNNDTFDHWPVESFFSEFYHPGLLTELLSGKHPQAPVEMSRIDRRQPKLQLIVANEQTGGKIASREVPVKITVSEAAAGAQDVRLFRNGSLVKAWRGDVLKGKSSVTLAATVPIIAGENRLIAYAFNRSNVKSGDATIVVDGADSLKRKGVIYIVAIGINEYANPDYTLRYAVADAEDFAAEVKRQQAELNNYDRVELRSLKDRQATKANILKAIVDVAATIQPEDVVMIYFAGHGTAQQHCFYLLPHDLGYMGSRDRIDRDQTGMQTLLEHGISDEELQRAVEGIDAGQLVMVMDACNSGQALEAEEKRRGPMNSKGLAQLAYEKGMYILTATESYQKAREPDRLGHGYLTYALVDEGLKTNVADRAPKDGQVLLREWFLFATERVPLMQKENRDDRAKQSRDAGGTFSLNDDDTLQRPRVFYRREIEATPFVAARPSVTASQICTRSQ